MRYGVFPNPQGASGCLIIPQDKRVSDLPANIQGRFGEAKLYRTIELDPSLTYVGLDVWEVLRSIAKKGYHIAGIPVRTVEQWPGKPAQA
jgi:uncharacterized protein YcgL (UPF0745 family)